MKLFSSKDKFPTSPTGWASFWNCY